MREEDERLTYVLGYVWVGINAATRTRSARDGFFVQRGMLCFRAVTACFEPHYWHSLRASCVWKNVRWKLRRDSATYLN